MKGFKFYFIAALAAAAFLTAGTVVTTSPADAQGVSKERRGLMKGMGGGLKGIGGALKSGNAKAAVGPAGKINANAMKLGDMWPAGSGGPDTRAKATIWADMGDFKAKMSALQTASAKLVSAANSGNIEAVKAAFGGVRGTCGACHKAHRAPKKK